MPERVDKHLERLHHLQALATIHFAKKVIENILLVAPVRDVRKPTESQEDSPNLAWVNNEASP